jgi:hypothetical protein
VVACEVVRGADALRGVLDWHVEAAKRDHFAAVGEVEVVKWCLLELWCGRGR